MSCRECGKSLYPNNQSGYCSGHHRLGERAKRLSAVQSSRTSKKRYQDNRQFVDEFKIQAGCTDCGYRKHPACLDFDHVRGKKIGNIAAMLTYSREAILAEIAKCEVVCANCHRIRTVERRRA